MMVVMMMIIVLHMWLLIVNNITYSMRRKMIDIYFGINILKINAEYGKIPPIVPDVLELQSRAQWYMMDISYFKLLWLLAIPWNFIKLRADCNDIWQKAAECGVK